jgi:hypothetical protein
MGAHMRLTAVIEGIDFILARSAQLGSHFRIIKNCRLFNRHKLNPVLIKECVKTAKKHSIIQSTEFKSFSHKEIRRNL